MAATCDGGSPATGRVLVTGANGMLGSHVVDRLAADGIQVLAVDRVPPTPGYMSTAPGELVEFVEADILDRTAMRPLIADVDAVIHVAGMLWGATGEDADGLLSVNVVATHNLLEDACAVGSGRMVFASSGSVYGDSDPSADGDRGFRESDPMADRSFYGLSKHVSELYAEAFAARDGLRYVALRLGVLYGPRLRMGLSTRFLLSVLDDIDAGEVPTVDGNPDSALDWVNVADAAECAVRALSPGTANGPVNVSTGRATRLEDVLTELLELYGADTGIRWTAPESARRKQTRFYDASRAQDVLGFAPSPDLRSGLRDFLYWRQQQRQSADRASERPKERQR